MINNKNLVYLMESIMRIVVVGAGCIGTIIASRLVKAGHEVTVIARGERLANIQAHGLRMQTHGKSRIEYQDVTAYPRLTPDMTADFVIVTVQRHQIDALMPDLIAHPSHNIVFMFNCVTNDEQWRHPLKGRLLWAFPAALGELKNGIVHYSVLPRSLSLLQITTIGGHAKRHASAIKLMKIFNKAKIPSTFHDDMPAWLKTHAALMLPVMAIGSQKLHTQQTLTLSWLEANTVAQAMQECFDLVNAAGSITPLNMKLVSLMPSAIIAFSLMTAFQMHSMQRILARHAGHASDEIQELYLEMKHLAKKQQVEIPSLDTLCADLLLR
jgi:2-dehydropantoate 2-reductase